MALNDIDSQSLIKQETRYIMSMPPINSSGDIYHILAFLILAIQNNDIKIPWILLTYDTDDTKTQAERGLTLATALGYENYFSTPIKLNEINSKGHRQNVRQSRLTEFLNTQATTFGSILYLDQKASTNYLAHHFIQDRLKTSEKLRKGYSQRNPKVLTDQTQNTLVAYANYWLDDISRSKSNVKQPIIILHIRHSSNANEDQNLPDSFLKPFVNYIENQGGYRVWCIFADGRTKGSFNGIEARRISPFCPPLKKNKNSYDFLANVRQLLSVQNNQYDFGKLFHLQLLLALKNNEHLGLKGIIGNTSGTFDLAAFIGHNCYNIHAFKPTISYQDYRILMQMSLFSVENFNALAFANIRFIRDGKETFTTENTSAVLHNFNEWITQENNSFLAPLISFQEPNYTHEGFWELLYGMKFENDNPSHVELDFSQQIKAFVLKKLHDAFIEKIVKLMINLLTNEKYNIRAVASEVIAKLVKTNIIPMNRLLGLLKHPNELIQEGAIVSLGKLAAIDESKIDKSAIELLMNSINHKSYWIRSHAAEALTLLGIINEKIILTLLEAKIHEKTRTRYPIGNPDDGEYEEVPESPQIALDKVGLYNLQKAQKLIHLFKNSNPQTCCNLIKQIIELATFDKNVITTLIENLGVREKARDWETLKSITKVLANLAKIEKTVLDFLFEASNDKQAIVKKCALEALAQNENQNINIKDELIKELLSTTRWFVRAAVANVLKHTNVDVKRIIIPCFEHTLDHSEEHVCLGSAKILISFGYINTKISNLVKDNALFCCSKKINHLIPEIIEVYINLLKHDTYTIRHHALTALAKMGKNKKIIEAFKETINPKMSRKKEIATDLLSSEGSSRTEAFMDMLYQETSLREANDFRYRVAEVLINFGETDDQIIEILEHALNNLNINIKLSAAKILVNYKRSIDKIIGFCFQVLLSSFYRSTEKSQAVEILKIIIQTQQSDIIGSCINFLKGYEKLNTLCILEQLNVSDLRLTIVLRELLNDKNHSFHYRIATLLVNLGEVDDKNLLTILIHGLENGQIDESYVLAIGPIFEKTKKIITDKPIAFSLPLHQPSVEPSSERTAILPPRNILIGIMPDKSKKEFEEFEALADGNCGFYVLGIQRKELVDLLLPLSQDTKIRQEIAIEIKNALLTNDLGSAKTELSMQLYKYHCELRDSQPILEQEANKLIRKLQPSAEHMGGIDRLKPYLKAHSLLLPEYKSMLDRLEQHSKSSEECATAINLYVESKETYEKYILSLGKTGWLGQKVATLVAKIKHFNLYIWSKMEKEPQSLNLLTSYSDIRSTQTIHMLYQSGVGHFNHLIEISNNLSPTSNETNRYLMDSACLETKKEKEKEELNKPKPILVHNAQILAWQFPKQLTLQPPVQQTTASSHFSLQ